MVMIPLTFYNLHPSFYLGEILCTTVGDDRVIQRMNVKTTTSPCMRETLPLQQADPISFACLNLVEKGDDCLLGCVPSPPAPLTVPAVNRSASRQR